jgi:hypothetical protein
MDEFEPWAKYPGLTKGRLSAVASLMRDVRDTALSVHEPDAGDNAWSLGCRVYARTCFTLRRQSEANDWLDVLQEAEALRFTFSIGRVPLKFYRGDVGDAPGHCRVVSDAESAAQQLLLDLGEIALDDRLLRLAVTTDTQGRTLGVVLAEMDKTGRVTGQYSIPFDDDGQNAVPALSPGIDPGPPPLTIRNVGDNVGEERQPRRERNAG